MSQSTQNGVDGEDSSALCAEASMHQPMPSRRQRRYGLGRHGCGRPRMCPHCGRTFKRTEHLDRHVRTHTKEKPFTCHCGLAFSRRDLLTRHRRIALHEDASVAEDASPSTTPSENLDLDPPALHGGGPSDAHMAAAVSLSGMSLRNSAAAAAAAASMAPVLPLQPDMYVMDYTLQRHEQEGIAYQQGLSGPFFESATATAAAAADHGTTFDPHFMEFANFLDGVGLPAEWSPYFYGPDRYDGERAETEDLHTTAIASHHSAPPRTRPGTPFSSWLPSAPTGDRISNSLAEDPPMYSNSEQQRFRVTDEQRSKWCTSLESFRDIVGPNFRFPSRHALTRYILSFFEGFHSHLPLIHTPTWHLSDRPLELILGMVAIGAQYCFDHRVSESLFHAGKAILVERLLDVAHQPGSSKKGSSVLALQSRSFLLAAAHQRAFSSQQQSDRQTNSMPNSTRNWGPWDPIASVQALVCLMGYATWEPKTTLLDDAFALRDLLVQLLRGIGLAEGQDGQEGQEGQEGGQGEQEAFFSAAESSQVQNAGDPAAASPGSEESLQRKWMAWIRKESSRRSKLIAYSFIHIHSVAYNVYPVLRSNEVHLRLPCSTKEWKAPTAARWLLARKDNHKRQLLFQDALGLLFRNTDGATPLDPIPTPLGNYVLLHGILQRIHIVRDLGLPASDHTAALPKEEADTLERGLRSWTSGWQQAPESSLDPNNENGPIPFTSSSMLALAYVRIYLDLGPYRKLETRDPASIAKAIFQSPALERNDGVIAALLYSTHMLSIPVRLGVDRVARSQAFFWSVRHSLSGLDCAILLSKWLMQLGEASRSKSSSLLLSDSEDRILHWVRTIVEEAYAVVDFEDVDHGDGDGVDADPILCDFRDFRNLGLAVLKIWAHFFQSNTQWLFINMIGTSLKNYRHMQVLKSLPQ